MVSSPPIIESATSKRLGALLAERQRRIDKAYGESSLYAFTKLMWPVLEPATEFIEGWVPQAICEHLQAVSNGQIKRLIINVPTGFSKSIITCSMWPAFEWGPMNLPHLRYLLFSYSDELSLRDNDRCRDLISSPEYQRLWGDRVQLLPNQNAKGMYGNTAKGWRLASSTGAKTTGFRGNRVVLDDPHNVKDGESKQKMETTVRWFRESAMTRLNDHRKDAVVVIMQRISELDVCGMIMSEGLDFEKLIIPMHFDTRRIYTNGIGWTDPRGLDSEGYPLIGAELDAREGDLAWPERICDPELAELELQMGSFAVSGQFNQSPSPRGGAIFGRDDWQPWPPAEWWDRWEAELFNLEEDQREQTLAAMCRDKRAEYPPFDYVLASLDTAQTEKTENDYSALTIWGVWYDTKPRTTASLNESDDVSRWSVMPESEVPKMMLIHGWQKRLLLHGPPLVLPPGVEDRDWRLAMRRIYRKPDSTEVFPEPGYGEAMALQYIRSGRHREKWGLVEWVADSCRRFNVDQLIIESTAAGFQVSSEMQRLYADMPFAVNLVPVGKLDKVARAHSVQHFWANKQIYVFKDHQGMVKTWAEPIIDEMAVFPKGAHDDATDSCVMAIRYLRDRGMLIRNEEANRAWDETVGYKRTPPPLYQV